MSSFLDLVDAVGAYYGTGSDQWNIIAQNGINSPEALSIISQVPGVNVTTSNSGKILGYDFDNAFPNNTPASSVINSNTQTGAYGNSFSGNIPATATPPDTAHPNGTMNSGAVTGAGATLAAVADKVSLAVAGVALGTKLGKLIDAGIYAVNPEWFDEHFPSINPETWDDMATTQGGKQFIRSLFGLQNDEATMYMDERLLAQMYMMLRANGAYSSGGTAEVPEDNPLNISPFTYSTGISSGAYFQVKGGSGQYNFANVKYGYECGVASPTGTRKQIGSIFASNNPNEKYYASGIEEDPLLNRKYPEANPQSYTLDGKTVYYAYSSSLGITTDSTINANCEVANPAIPQFTSNYKKMAWLMIYGGYTPSSGLDGVSDNPNASTFIDPSIINGQDLNTVLQQLRDNYPQLFDGSVYTNVPQPDGSTTTITYIPVPYPNNANTTQPITDTTPDINPQIEPAVNPSTRPNAAENVATDVTTPVNNTPDTGTGSSPTTTAPTGGASSLWAIYNPTQTQVDDFGAWLWSSNFVDQIKKLFSDPMQGIIGLHKVFATPATGAAQNIKVGYLDSGVPSAVVTSQYTDVDCGAVNVAEYFGNVFDYEDTAIRLYLPFIGIVDLSTSDVMRGNVRVVYHVDVITGACLADVIVTRDGAGGVLYQYSGDAAVRYPVSSGSYMGMVNGVLAIAGAVVGVASGGAALPAVMGAVGGIMNSHTDVKHSGSFSGAAGAMGAKIPYLIIERPQTAIANDFASYQGIGDNRTLNVGSLAGYFKMTDVHTEGVVNASEQEIEQIKTLLEGGVIQ